jgi:hypothetical protein
VSASRLMALKPNCFAKPRESPFAIESIRRKPYKTPETGLAGWGTWIRTKINGVRVRIEPLISFAYFANWGKKRSICFNRL